MRLATITNWAYGATVVLTLASATTMLLASHANDREQAAVEQRYQLDKLSDDLEAEVLLPTDHARQYLDTGDPTYGIIYRRDVANLRSIEVGLGHLRDAGASVDEVHSLRDAARWAATLEDEQTAAIAAHEKGDEQQARHLLFGPEYERDLDQARRMIDRFDDKLEQRTQAEVTVAKQLSLLWKNVAEIVLCVTGLLFLGVLSFIFKRRVLRPVLRLSDVVGRLAAQDYAVEPPSFDQIDEIGDMAQAICIFRENGLERQRLEEERKADVTMRDLLSRMTQRMQGCDTLEDLKDVVRRFVPEIAPTLAGTLYLLDQAGQQVTATCSWLDPVASKPEFPPVACWALRRGLPHRPSGDIVDVRCEHLSEQESGDRETVCLPLMAQRETLGLLYFETRRGFEGEAQTPEIYLHMLAENISLALANLRLRDALRDLAMADPLTGLANRRSLESMLKVRIADADRTGQPISCLMLDVDHFKRFNDQFGHEAGDAVLREVGAVLRSATRDDGLAFRYGGEEFVLLLPGATAEQASARAEDIRGRIARLKVEQNGMPLGSITASIGIASAPEHGRSSDIATAADGALLRAKLSGRDRVEAAEKMPQERAA
jgi:diguanylate cyclase (GGDEF)-like protein